MSDEFATPARRVSMRELPDTERPRERMRALGAQALSTNELIAAILGGGTVLGSAIACAERVLEQVGGSLGRLAAMPIAALTSVPGVGIARATAVHAALELGRRMSAEAREAGAPLRSPRDVVAAFEPRLRDLPVEEFHVAILDATASARTRCPDHERFAQLVVGASAGKSSGKPSRNVRQLLFSYITTRVATRRLRPRTSQ